MRSAGAAALLLFAFAAPLPGQSGPALGQYRRGEKLYEEGDLAGALRAFQQAYATDPRARRGERIGMHFTDYDPTFQLGRLHARLGNFEEAERFFAEAARNGYTERSGNAEEYRRWRATVERTLSAARAQPTPVPRQAAAPAPTAIPAVAAAAPAKSEERPASARPDPSATPIAVVTLRESPFAFPTRPRDATRTPLPAAIAEVSPPSAPTVPPATPVFSPALPIQTVVASPRSRSEPGRALLIIPVLLFGGAGGLVLFLLLRARRRKHPRVGGGAVPFGRYAIAGLLGTGRSSFVYEAFEGRGRQPVALKIRRPDRPPIETERFAREAEGLDRARRPGVDLPVPKLLARGVRKTPRGAVEYVAMEKLSGRSLLSLSRRARRRLDPALSVEILREIAQVIKRVRALGLAHEDLTAEDIFLMEPVPSNAGNTIRLKIFGLTAAPSDPARDALALESVAAELFRGRASAWDQDDWVAEHVPAALREVLVRVRDSKGAPGGSFDDVERALRGIARPSRGGGDPA